MVTTAAHNTVQNSSTSRVSTTWTLPDQFQTGQGPCLTNPHTWVRENSAVCNYQ